MSRKWMAVAFAVAVGGVALAGAGSLTGCGGTKDGGDLRWQRDPAKGFELAHAVGKPMLLYFTSDGWRYCTELSAGAFSDSAVVKAAKSVVCVFVDCEWGKQHGDLLQKYRVRGFPTVVYTDSEGEEVGRMEDREPEAMLRELNELAAGKATAAR